MQSGLSVINDGKDCMQLLLKTMSGARSLEEMVNSSVSTGSSARFSSSERHLVQSHGRIVHRLRPTMRAAFGGIALKGLRS